MPTKSWWTERFHKSAEDSVPHSALYPVGSIPLMPSSSRITKVNTGSQGQIFMQNLVSPPLTGFFSNWQRKTGPFASITFVQQENKYSRFHPVYSLCNLLKCALVYNEPTLWILLLLSDSKGKRCRTSPIHPLLRVTQYVSTAENLSKVDHDSLDLTIRTVFHDERGFRGEVVAHYAHKRETPGSIPRAG